jgi:hypothetical protein
MYHHPSSFKNNAPKTCFLFLPNAPTQAYEDLVAVYGSPFTNWEKLQDSASAKPYWFHVTNGKLACRARGLLMDTKFRVRV